MLGMITIISLKIFFKNLFSYSYIAALQKLVNILRLDYIFRSNYSRGIVLFQ